MKLFKTLFFSLAIGLIVLSVSCSKDDAGPKNEVLLVSHRYSGQFYTIDLVTGEKSEAFTLTYDGEALTDTRAFVYHPQEKKFFISQATNSGGYLYSVNVSTMVATMINDNDGSDNDGTAVEWDAVNNWYVDGNGDLLAIGDFNDDVDNGLVTFSTDGARGIPVEADICCGMGMLYEAGDDEITVGSGWNGDLGLIEIVTVDFSGNVTLTNEITTFNGFSEIEDLTNVRLHSKTLAKAKNGTIYGIVYSNAGDNGTGNSYFVSFNLSDDSITYISTLGEGNSNQYNTMAFVPSSSF